MGQDQWGGEDSWGRVSGGDDSWGRVSGEGMTAGVGSVGRG